MPEILERPGVQVGIECSLGSGKQAGYQPRTSQGAVKSARYGRNIVELILCENQPEIPYDDVA
ncbi:hypothetical protein BDR03DRAFT_955461 [Suillus americanus]|nr:hypothetical protein BDR03DRAFT_955461 [Suillus americanus]